MLRQLLTSFTHTSTVLTSSTRRLSEHTYIRDHVFKGRPVQRTPPWAEEEVASSAQLPARQGMVARWPFTDVVDEIEETKIALRSKLKIKTRGTTALAVHPSLNVQAIEDELLKGEQCTKPIEVDKRSHKVLKSLFHVPSSEPSEYLRAIN
ncbi:hypothetical protein BU25DRAFT_461468 [Macroventuria anomochaeta]|uniref:Uncharacterized protein n=1 Tax=Macroventuria anomochaeta TaxID=301207 RepID=A0ACB6RRD8_9PLEO|nr:uncharacterized protein BU25DRAFT_461468 [Macroventuria anomochaeta]KAF2623965.1 hypothetical protein BU25DRAFT_461468 [Macroventuria anomochaeta]